MITKEEATKISYEQGNGDDLVIDEIYKSVGSCIVCQHYSLPMYTPRGELRFPLICKLTLTNQASEHFCAEFKEVK